MPAYWVRSRLIVLLIFVFSILGSAVATAGWIGGIEFDHPSPSYLPHGEDITVTIDCFVTEPGGARIYVMPFTDGSPTLDYQYQGSTLLPLGEQTVTRYFSVGGSADRTVDHVRIRMVSPDLSEVYMEFFVRVRYEFGPYGIFNIQLSEVEHSVLTKGTDLVVNFDYGSPGPEDVTLYARPYTDGALTPGYGASGGHTGSSSGTASQLFSFHSTDADVDHIWIYMRNAANNQTLFEVFHPVDYSWRDVGITNLSFDVPSPSQVWADDDVTMSFDYQNDAGENIKIWVRPYLDGGFCPYNFFQGSTSIPAGTNSSSRYFGANGPTRINQAHLLVTNDDYSTTYIDKLIPVDFEYSEHMVYDIETIPESPALMDFGTLLDIIYHYKSTDPGPIFIYAEPYYRGSLVGNHSSTGSPALSTPFGAYGLDIRIEEYSPIHEADQLRFSIWDNSSNLLSEYFVDASFLWGEDGTISGVGTSIPGVHVRLGQNFPNPFNPLTTIPVDLSGTRYVRLAVYDLRGRLVKILADEMMGAGRHDLPFDGTGLASGVYHYRLEGAGTPKTGSMTLIK